MQLVVLVVAVHAASVDFRFRILPNTFTSFIAIVGISSSLLNHVPPNLMYWIFTVAHFVVAIMFENSFGMGDVKLFAGLGFFLPDADVFLTWIVLSYGSSMVWGLVRRERSVAFGPHIVMAWMLCCMGDYAHVSFPDRW